MPGENRRVGRIRKERGTCRARARAREKTRTRARWKKGLGKVGLRVGSWELGEEGMGSGGKK